MAARYASLPQTARYLGISERTLWRHRARGVVPSCKVVGRVVFDLDEIDAWVRSSADPRPSANTAEEYAAAAKAEARNRRRRSIKLAPGGVESARLAPPGRTRVAS